MTPVLIPVIKEAGIDPVYFGVLFIITFLTSIPAALLYQPVLDDPAGYLAGEGQDGHHRPED